MKTAYDPVRVRQLRALTATAIDSIAIIRSPDPDAMDALRSLRLLRRNLEELWMPLLRNIETSRAMVEWTASMSAYALSGQAMIVDWISDHTAPRNGPYEHLTDDELYDLIMSYDESNMPFDGHGGYDITHQFWSTTLSPIAAELARRANASQDFAGLLLDAATRNPVIGLAVARADFEPAYVREVASTLLHHRWQFDDGDSRAYAAATDALLSSLAASPDECLTLLADSEVLYQLASWPLLDQRAVEAFIHAGVYTAVATDPALLRDGYEVMQELVVLANGDLNDGFNAGMSRGLATSMIGYADTLVPAVGITKECGGDVQINTFDEHGFSLVLGDYEEVTNLFGAIARDIEAQAALGVTVGVYVNQVTAELGASIDDRSALGHAAQFADLIGDSVSAEQAEMVAAAAAETMRLGSMGTVIGFGVNAAASAAGVGTIGGFVIRQVVKAGTQALTTVEPGTMPNAMVRHVTHDAIVVAAVTLAQSDAQTRAANDLDDDDAAAGDVVDAHLVRLDELSADGDLAGYQAELSRMETFIVDMPHLDEFVNGILDDPAVNELTEGHAEYDC